MNKRSRYIVLSLLILVIAGCAVIASLDFTVGCKSKLRKICDEAQQDTKVIDKTIGTGCDGSCMSVNYTLEIVSNGKICYYITEYEQYDPDEYQVGSTYGAEVLGDGFCTLDEQPTSLEALTVIFSLIGGALLITLIFFILCCMVPPVPRPKTGETDYSDDSSVYPL